MEIEFNKEVEYNIPTLEYPTKIDNEMYK